MKYFAVALLVATVSTQMPGMGISGPSAGAKAIGHTYETGINADPAKDAAYWNDELGVSSHSTGNYTYTIKPNEYTSWNGISYTHNYDSTGTHGGANRIPVHDYPVFDNGVEKQQQTIDAHPKTEYGTHLHTAVPEPCTTCWQWAHDPHFCWDMYTLIEWFRRLLNSNFLNDKLKYLRILI